MRTVVSCALLASALAVVGCGAAEPAVGRHWVAEAASIGGGSIYEGAFAGPMGGGEGAALFGATAPAGVGSRPSAAAEQEPASASVAAVEVRRVIYTGTFDVVVPDVEKAVRATRKMAEQMTGYVQKMTGDTIVIRVPAEKFDEAVVSLGQLGTITQREVNAQDVTEDYEDLALRLENAKVLIDKLRKLLDRAQTVKEALEVEKEIARVRTEVEQLDGKLNRLKSQVAYATITARFVPTQEAPQKVRAQLPFLWLDALGLDNLFNFQAH
jgi:hypothetical protein